MLSAVDHSFAPAAAICRRRFRNPSQAFMALALAAGLGCAAPGRPHHWDGARAALNRVRRAASVDPQAARRSSVARSAERATAIERPPTGVPTRACAPGCGTESARRLKEVRALPAARVEHARAAEVRSRQPAAGSAGRDERSRCRPGRRRADHVETARRLADGDYPAAIDHAAEALNLAAGLDASWNRNHVRFSDSSLIAMWRGQAEAAIDESRRSTSAAIVIDKLRRKVSLYKSGRRVAQFDAELGSNGLERKRYSGDRATPEGRYRITVKKAGRATKYYLALLIDYPNAGPAAPARQQGRFRSGPGSAA
jgi:hypothetical protein